MKTSEATNKILGLSKHYTVVKGDYHFSVYYKGDLIIWASEESEYTFALSSSKFWENKNFSFRKLSYFNKLYMIIAEYSLTKIEDRKDNPKRYHVKVPHTKDIYYWKNGFGMLAATHNFSIFQDEKLFTMDEIKAYGLEECERVEAE